jgi:outer membrane protein assembly factor BamD
MLKFKTLFLIVLLILCISCAKEIKKESVLKEKSLDLQVLEAYQGGLQSLEEGDVLFAAKKFNEAEILFPQSQWAPKSALMAAYAYYSQDYYGDAIAELNRFIKVYPLHKNIDYAYYLLVVSYYEQIVDEKKDLQSILNAQNYFEIILNKFPNTEYAVDVEFKINLINDILASKEIYLGRYYLEKKKWIPAINRFRTVIDDYDTTIYTEEALYRLVEIYYIIGMKNEAEKYAQLLGYNYQSSKWYERSYNIFNRIYEKEKIKKEKNEKRNNNFLIKRFKYLLD